MPQIGNLPDEVVLHLLRVCIGAPAWDLRSWKQKFELLAICRQWRELGLSLVYSQAFIECRECIKPPPGSIVRKSNVSFIVSQGYWPLVRRLSVAAVAQLHPLKPFNDVLAFMAQEKCSFSRVHSLSIRSHIRKPASGGGEALEDTAREALMEVARGLALAVPNVTRLYMGSYQMEKMSRTLSGLLIDSFVKRLRIVDCMSPVVLTVPEFSGQLTQLNIALDSSAEKLLPRICARTLQNLRLYHVPRSFSWEAFQDRLTPGHIHFACLRDVSLYFTELQGGHEDHHLSSGYAGLPSGEGCKLHFPQVRRLKIDCCPPYCEALYASQLPSSMETLSYSGTLGTMDALTSLKLQRIADVALSVYSTGEDDMDSFYHATNHIYGDVEITRESVLELTQSTITLDPQRVAWPNLSQLHIHGLYEFELLVGLLGRLPMLRRLDMHGLAMNNLQTGTFIPALEGAELSPLPLVGPRLQKLTLYEDTRSTYSDLAALAIQSLVLRLRSLRRLNLSGRLQIDKDSFVPRYSSRFSHLERLTIKSYVMV